MHVAGRVQSSPCAVEWCDRELRPTYEALSVAEEEIRVQNEDLTHARSKPPLSTSLAAGKSG
jgi:hypothetical protein